MIDLLLAEAALLSERIARSLLWRLPESRAILTRPAYPGESARAAEFDRIEEALLWCGWFAQDRETLAQAREAWDDAVSFRWQLVLRANRFKRATDANHERALAMYRAACLFDPSRRVRFWTFAKYRSTKAVQRHHGAMERPVRLPHDAAEQGVEVQAARVLDSTLGACSSPYEYEPTWLAWALDQLSPRLRRVTALRTQGKSLSSIAEILHVTPAHVAALERSAIETLRALR